MMILKTEKIIRIDEKFVNLYFKSNHSNDADASGNTKSILMKKTKLLY